MYHFKTEWCPYSKLYHRSELEKLSCVYAHSFKDFRRKPNIFSYSPEQECNLFRDNRDAGSEMLDDYCLNGYLCSGFHNEQERLYHPQAFKLEECKNGFCEIQHCPFFHTATGDEREKMPEGFLPAVKNRGICQPSL